MVQKQLRRRLGLAYQHPQPSHGGNIQPLCVQHQLSPGGVIHNVAHPPAQGKQLQIQRRLAGVGVHPHGGGVEDESCVRVAVQVAVVVRAAPGDHHHLPRAEVLGHRPGGEGRAPAAQHQHFPAHELPGQPRLLQQTPQAVVIRVMAVERAVRAAKDRIDAANALGNGRKLCAVGNDRRFVRQSHVQAGKFPGLQKGTQLLRLEGVQLIGPAPQPFVDFGGKAVF